MFSLPQDIRPTDFTSTPSGAAGQTDVMIPVGGLTAHQLAAILQAIPDGDVSLVSFLELAGPSVRVGFATPAALAEIGREIATTNVTTPGGLHPDEDACDAATWLAFRAAADEMLRAAA